jgi:phosphohistidine phosphatase
VKLLVIRHAPAGDRVEFARTGRPDDERPLTPEGRRKMRANATGLRAVVPDVALLATSPFTRARETARIVAKAYPDVTPVEVSALAHGGDRDAIREWLANAGVEGQVVAVVGHEPDLGQLIGWLVTGRPDRVVTLKKGGACLLECDDAIAPGTAEVRWLLPPRLLRQLAT